MYISNFPAYRNVGTQRFLVAIWYIYIVYVINHHFITYLTGILLSKHLQIRKYIREHFFNIVVDIILIYILAFHAGSVHVWRFYVLQFKNTSMPHNFCCSIGPLKMVFEGFRFRGWGWLNNLYNTFINITQRLWQTSERISIITFFCVCS